MNEPAVSGPAGFQDFESLYSSYEQDMEAVERALAGLFESSSSLIPLIGGHIMKSGGKRIRPLFLLAAADMFGYRGDDRIIIAGILEAIHTASLLHDDVVDGASVRRGQPTAHSLWGNQVVVLVGDFLYANALRTAVLQENQLVMEHLSQATTRMTEGEILQMGKTADPHITEEEYFSIIAGKTGALISAACSLGAIVSGQKKEVIDLMAEFGLRIGEVFQMTDDILDYSSSQEVFGKKMGKDLEEGKITLPVIMLREVATDREREETDAIIQSDEGDFPQRLKRIMELFDKYSIEERSMAKAYEQHDKAISLMERLDPDRDTEGIRVLADYALRRTK